MKKKFPSAAKGVLIVLCVVLILLMVPFLALHIATRPSVLNALCRQVPAWIDARVQIHIGNIDYRLLNSWPDAELQVEDMLILSDVIAEGDTLLHARHARLSFRLKEFLIDNRIGLNYCHLDSIALNARVAGGKQNWDVFAPTEPDSNTSTLPLIRIEEASLLHTHLRYRDEDSQQQAQARALNLRVEAVDIQPSLYQAKINLLLDSLCFSNNPKNARYSLQQVGIRCQAALQDSVLLANTQVEGMVNWSDSLLHLQQRKLQLLLHAQADTGLQKLCIDSLFAGFDDNTVAATGQVWLPDSLHRYADLQLHLNLPQLQQVIALVPTSLLPQLEGIQAEGALALHATAKGWLTPNSYPVCTAQLKLSNGKGRANGQAARIDRLNIDLKGRYNDAHKDSSYLNVNTVDFASGKSHLQLQGGACYRQQRLYTDLRLKSYLHLKEIFRLYPMDDLRVRGLLTAQVNAQFFVDDLLEQHLYDIHSQTTITGDSLRVRIPSQRLSLSADSLRLKLFTNTERNNRNGTRKDTALMNASFSFMQMNLRYNRQIKAAVDRLRLSLLADDMEPGKTPRLRISMALKNLETTLSDTLQVRSKGIAVSASVKQNQEHRFVPTGTVRLRVDSLTASSPDLGMFMDSTRIVLNTTPRFRSRRRVAKGVWQPIPDSQQKTVDMDSLLRLFDGISQAEDVADFYLKKFTTQGDISMRRLRLQSPDYPIKASANRFSLKFSDDTLLLDNLSLRAGKSNLKFSGELHNMRRYLLRGRTLQGELNLRSRRIDLNQLIGALQQGELAAQQRAQKADEALVAENMNELEDAAADELNATENDSIADFEAEEAVQALFVIPKNLDLKLTADIQQLLFSKIALHNLQGGVSLKNSCLRIKQLSTSTEIGNAYMNVLYRCSQPTTAEAAVSMEMDSIAVGDLIAYLPELDSILPMLRSLDGRVFCETSASTQLDSSANFVLPSVNAALKLKGEDLVLMDGETFSQIAKMLMFNKKTKNKIDSVAVEVLVRNNEIEVYPFMLRMDKYRLAAGGVQNLDGSFNYHVAMLRPLIAAVDVYGTDFDHIKFRLARARFKDPNVQIAKGGTLVRTGTNLREVLHQSLLNMLTQEEDENKKGGAAPAGK